MHRRFAPLLITLAAVLPTVSSCAKPAPPPTVLELKTFESREGGFSVEMPEPHKEKSIDLGKVYYFNCPEGTYKIVVNTVMLANRPANNSAMRMARDNEAIDNLKNHAGKYIDDLNTSEKRDFLLDSKYKAFEKKGTTGSIPGGADGLNHMKTNYTENDIALPNTVINGSYTIQGFIGENAAYILAVEGRPDFVNSENARKFFDSFKITGITQIGVHPQ